MRPAGWGATAWAEHQATQTLSRYRDEMRLAHGNRNYAHQAAQLASALDKLLNQLEADRQAARS